MAGLPTASVGVPHQCHPKSKQKVYTCTSDILAYYGASDGRSRRSLWSNLAISIFQEFFHRMRRRSFGGGLYPALNPAITAFVSSSLHVQRSLFPCDDFVELLGRKAALMRGGFFAFGGIGAEYRESGTPANPSSNAVVAFLTQLAPCCGGIRSSGCGSSCFEGSRSLAPSVKPATSPLRSVRSIQGWEGGARLTSWSSSHQEVQGPDDRVCPVHWKDGVPAGV